MSLTIQAPHANMNAYEIGDDETRKNKVSDKGTIYAGDLQFAQTTGNAASDKKQSARKQAMKLIRDAWDSDNKAVSQRDQIAQQKEEKLKEVRECNEELKQIRESKEIARQSYGVDPDSQEQKDLELLEKYQDYQKGVQTDDFSKEEIDRLKELQNTPLTDYQTRALQLNAQKDVILNKKDRAQRNVTSLTEAAADAKLDFDNGLCALFRTLSAKIGYTLFGDDDIYRVFAVILVRYHRDDGADLALFGNRRTGKDRDVGIAGEIS